MFTKWHSIRPVTQAAMHELSIAHSLVELAGSSAAAAGATRVRSVHLRLGALSGVVKGSLEFCYEIATADTLLAGSILIVQELPVVVHCAVCFWDVELASIQSFRCPACNTPSGDIRQGRELEIESIEIDVAGDDLPDTNSNEKGQVHGDARS
jgi:hydrogenase nickel incorporation protein HypA/HybF